MSECSIFTKTFESKISQEKNFYLHVIAFVWFSQLIKQSDVQSKT